MFSLFKNKKNPEKLFIGEDSNAIEVIVKRHAASKNIRIRINLKNQVILTLPEYIPLLFAKKLLYEKEEWIRTKLVQKEDAFIKDNIVILGKEYKILYNQTNLQSPIEFCEDKILVSHFIKEDKIYPLLELYLRKIAKLEIEKYCYEVCAKLNVRFKRITIKDTITRWGSCSSNKNLAFSWRLILAPRNVMEYVVVHEICHLIEMNHSSKFWNLVYQTCPDYFEAKLWLKRHGKKLHE